MPKSQMIAYRLLIILFSPILLGHILWKAISHQQGRYLWQRLGFAAPQLPDSCRWFHCASVGEVNTLLPLLRRLHASDESFNCLITTNTITGASIVEQQSLAWLHHAYLPFDWRSAIKRFLSATKPTALYVVETEIWPNLYACCRQKNIDISIINARLSSKTSSAKPWIKAILKASLTAVKAIHARSQKDADAYMSLGADSSIVDTVGNLKLTTSLSMADKDKPDSFSSERQYVLLASTHKNEEAGFAGIWRSLDRDELLIIAPRHPERAASIIKQLDGFKLAIRSRDEKITEDTDIYLLDTVGELKNYFANAKLVVMGGSFAPIGGHNILEPASFARAIVTGPHMENFSEELQLMLDNDAIIQADSYETLHTTLLTLLADKTQRQQLEENTAKLTHDAETVLQAYAKLLKD